ncbi:MAG: PaaI family thioesterase [Chloroflexi bacterium]|nr:MAG: PaaI family thioesterase [Chloroflexota bacterium]
MNQQPVSRNCFVCGVENPIGLGMRFYETNTDPVQVIAEYTVPARYQGYPGVVHGGIVATMLDEVTSRTIFRGNPPRFVVTARLSIRYRKPVPVETPLRLTGRIVEDKGRVITVAGEIQGPGGILLAEAEAVVVEVEPSFFGEDIFSSSDWQVYPDAHPVTDSVESRAASGADERSGGGS